MNDIPLDLEQVKKDIAGEKILQVQGKSLNRFLLILIIIVAAEAVLFLFVAGGAVVHKSSMYPEIHDGDFVVYNRLNKNLAGGDIVIIRGKENGLYYIKRVIALEGDEVSLTDDGKVCVNGVQLNEPYVQNAPTAAQDIAFPQTVPRNSVFVLGDNRLTSKDSRSSEIGMVAKENICGTLLFSLRLH